MNAEERQEAVFGAFDGVVSMMGVIFGALVVHTTPRDIFIIGFGASVAECISMSVGEVAKSCDAWQTRLGVALSMLAASFVGGIIPVWGFFAFSVTVALTVGAIGCFTVATWIGWMKRQGAKGFLRAYVVLVLASGASLAFAALINTIWGS